jgi:hypothetical protein
MSTAAENAALNGLDGTGATNTMPDMALNTADPGTTGASENANSGSYARQASSMSAAGSGAKVNSGTITFATGGTVAVPYFSHWSSATYGAGTVGPAGALAAAVTSTAIVFAPGAVSFTAT